MKKKIGIVGAGIMAAGMAQNFLKEGYDVHIWNRTKGRAQSVVGNGAEWCKSPKAVAQASDIIIECVSDDGASRSVWTDREAGILAGAGAAKVLIASSSLSLSWTDELGGLCKERGLQFLDMPLTGSRAGAESGTLKLMVGGEEAVLDSIRDDLGAVADKIFYFGPAGSGMRFKLMLNTLTAIHTDAAVQAALVAQRAGISPAVFHKALSEGAMAPASAATLNAIKRLETAPEMLNFSIRLLEKDLRYACEMAGRYGAEFNLLNDAQEDFADAGEQGLADEDITQIAKLYQ